MNDELCDEEISYHKWLKNNTVYVSNHKESIHVMKKIYLDGFAAGYEYRNLYNAKEQLQK